MKENTTNSTEFNHLNKKIWHEPQINQLEIKETKLGWGAQGAETWTNWFGS